MYCITRGLKEGFFNRLFFIAVTFFSPSRGPAIPRQLQSESRSRFDVVQIEWVAIFVPFDLFSRQR